MWLLSGSRSNPLALSIGNVLHDENEKDWLKDRNDGLFSTLPKDYVFMLFFIFALLGCITDITPRTLPEECNFSLQLECTSFVSGEALEL